MRGLQLEPPPMDYLKFSYSSMAFTVVVAWFIWSLCSWVYNLYLHPLAQFPGPKLTAMTDWWRTYVDCFSEDDLRSRLPALHSQYGDIVRIGPNELHFSKSSAYHEIYNPSRRWSKNKKFYSGFAEHDSTFTMSEYHDAKKRKDVLNPLFSRRAILDMQYLVQEKFNDLCCQLVERHEQNLSSNIYLAMRCFALDTITSFCFASSVDALKAPGFESQTVISMNSTIPIIMPFIHFKLFRSIMQKAPPRLIVAANKMLEGFVHLRIRIMDQITDIIAHPEKLADAPHPIIYHELLNTKEGRVPPTVTELNDEAWLLVFAGTDTVGNALTVGTIHATENRAIYERLHAELKQVWPKLEEVPRYEVLEKLPYLRAVMKEALRLSFGVVTPMSRVVPKEGAEISGKYIPGGTIVGLSTCFVHLDETIFPEAHRFNPDRWLEPSSESLDNWLVPFSKGPRSCLGINLAYCELYLAFANLFRRFDLKLDGVGTSDLRFHECFLPHYTGPDLNVFATPCDS